MKYKIIILKFICIVYAYSTPNKSRIWERIPKNTVDNHVISYFNENNIVNCYKFLEYNNLLLKCWVNNSLVDVSILINIIKI